MAGSKLTSKQFPTLILYVLAAGAKIMGYRRFCQALVLYSPFSCLQAFPQKWISLSSSSSFSTTWKTIERLGWNHMDPKEFAQCFFHMLKGLGQILDKVRKSELKVTVEDGKFKTSSSEIHLFVAKVASTTKFCKRKIRDDRSGEFFPAPCIALRKIWPRSKIGKTDVKSKAKTDLHSGTGAAEQPRKEGGWKGNWHQRCVWPSSKKAVWAGQGGFHFLIWGFSASSRSFFFKLCAFSIELSGSAALIRALAPYGLELVESWADLTLEQTAAKLCMQHLSRRYSFLSAKQAEGQGDLLDNALGIGISKVFFKRTPKGGKSDQNLIRFLSWPSKEDNQEQVGIVGRRLMGAVWANKLIAREMARTLLQGAALPSQSSVPPWFLHVSESLAIKTWSSWKRVCNIKPSSVQDLPHKPGWCTSLLRS